MKIKIKQNELAEALKKVYGICDGKVTPVLGNVFIQTGGKSIELIGSNYEISIKTSASAEIVESGKALFSASKLFQMTETLKDDIELSDNLIQSGKVKIVLESANVDEYPENLFDDEFKTTLNISSETLITGLQKTSVATSQLDKNNVLSGVNLIIKDGKINFYGCDGNISANYYSEIECKNDINVIIPINSVREIIKSFSNTDLTLSISKAVLMASDGDTTIKTPLLVGTYPPVGKFFTDKPNSFKINGDYLSSVLKRCNILRSNEKGAVNCLKFDLKSMAVELDFKGKLTETALIEKTGDDMDISFSIDYLATALKVLNLNELKFNYEESLRPAILTEDNFQFLIMPVSKK